MMDSNKNYVAQLDQVDFFPSQSFYQIRLDVPRLSLIESRKNNALKLFDNYTKRNSIANYLQSHGCIGSRIIN